MKIGDINIQTVFIEYRRALGMENAQDKKVGVKGVLDPLQSNRNRFGRRCILKSFQ